MNVDLVSALFPNKVEPDRAIFLYQLAMALLKEGHFVNVVNPIPFFPSSLAKIQAFGRWNKYALVPRAETIGPFDVQHPRYIVLPKLGFLSGWTYGCALAQALLGKNRTDRILSIHCGYPDGVGGALYAARTGRKFTLTLHGTDVNDSFKKRFLRPQMMFAFERASALIAVSNALREELPQPLKDRCRVISCAGYDPAKFQVVDRRQARRSLGLEETGKIILFVGTLRLAKGADRIPDMVLRLRKDETLCIIGDGELRDKLRERIWNANTAGNVRYYGNVPHARIPDWMNAADVLWMPSRAEGMPNVLIESLRCGTPVVATNVGDIPRILKDGVNGYLTRFDDINRMRIAITSAMAVDFQRAALSDSVEQFTWNGIARMYSSLFRELSC